MYCNFSNWELRKVCHEHRSICSRITTLSAITLPNTRTCLMKSEQRSQRLCKPSCKPNKDFLQNFTHPEMQLSGHSFIRSFILSFILSFIHSFIQVHLCKYAQRKGSIWELSPLPIYRNVQRNLDWILLTEQAEWAENIKSTYCFLYEIDQVHILNILQNTFSLFVKISKFQIKWNIDVLIIYVLKCLLLL